jgi:thiol-disulfide isomerase/thioredoxin
MDLLPAGRARGWQIDALPMGNWHACEEQLCGHNPSLQIRPTTASWFDILGPMLLVHDSHGDTIWDWVMPMARVLPTGDVLKGRTSIGLYFSADWCPSCTAFTPLLTQFYNIQKLGGGVAPFEVVLILPCKSKRATEHFFAPMPWTAMPHLALMGARGKDLMATFGVLTIPALVLLDGNGAVMCLDGRSKITEDPAGLGFPSSPVKTPRLLPDPWRQPRRASKPSGMPPTFGWAPQAVAAGYTGPPT